MWPWHWNRHEVTNLRFHLQASRARVLPQTHGVLDHLWAETILAEEGQGPAGAATRALPWCSSPGQEGSLCHRRVVFLHVLGAVGASGPKVSWREQHIGRALVADPSRTLSYLHDTCVPTIAARASAGEQHAAVRRDGGGSRRGKGESASQGRGKEKK